MSDVNLIVRTADQTRKAEVTLNTTNTGADVIQASVENWALPKDTDYTLVNTTSGKALAPNLTLGDVGVKDGDTLEIQPVLVAG